MPPSTKPARQRDHRRRARKAAALVPLALVSGSWTTFLLASATATSDASSVPPDRVSPPAAPIEAPASLAAVRRPPPGVAGPATSVRHEGIPTVALAAYQRAATVIDAADPTCHLGWPLLAAIGRVESDHGRHAGSLLSTDGVARPPIFSPLLDGRSGTSRIGDTDGGIFDRNRLVDRAVGPMQFIPSTWLVVGVDADGDHQRNPQDIDDAALAAAVYLCSGTGDLSTYSGVASAVYRYNHSTAYVDLVTRIAAEYSATDYASQAYSAYAPILPALAYHPAAADVGHHSHPPRASGGDTSDDQSGATTPSTPAPSSGHQPAPTPEADEPTSGPASPERDPVTPVVGSAESTVTDLLDQAQDLLPDLPPTP